jgi:hypothetical protein
MNKSHYTFAIIFLVLGIASSLFQSNLYLRVDNQIFIQKSFMNWFLVTNIVGLAGSLLMLKYYHFKKYDFTFKTAAVVTSLIVCQSIALYVILAAGKLQVVYLPIAFLVVIAAIVFSISLIFSEAGKRVWQKTGGIFFLIISVVQLSAGTGTLVVQDLNTKMMLQDVLKWTSVAYPLVSVFFIGNFISEVISLKHERGMEKMPEVLYSGLGIGTFAAVVAMFFTGEKLLKEGNSSLSWQESNKVFAKDVMAKDYEARVFVKGDGDTLRYQFMKPLDYDPQKKYPLVLCLHHGGTHGTDNFSQLGADPAPFLTTNRAKYPAFYLMPQCPKGFGWQFIDGPIYEIIKELESEFEIDEKRRYVMGISGGGYGSWYFITAKPEMFAAAIPICGGGDPSLAPKVVNVPVWAFHGEDDNLVPVRFSREMIEGIKTAGGNPKYTEFPGAGHNIWNQVVSTPGLMDWLFEQKRD